MQRLHNFAFKFEQSPFFHNCLFDKSLEALSIKTRWDAACVVAVFDPLKVILHRLDARKPCQGIDDTHQVGFLISVQIHVRTESWQLLTHLLQLVNALLTLRL